MTRKQTQMQPIGNIVPPKKDWQQSDRDLESAKYDYQCSQTEKNNVQKSYDDKVDEIKKYRASFTR